MDDAIVKKFVGYEEAKEAMRNASLYGTEYETQKGSWRDAVNRLHPPKIDLKVSEIRKISNSATTIRFVGTDKPLPPFQAGQYIHISVDIDGIHTGRPYSISSAPSYTAYYEITVKRKNDAFVSDYLLDKLRVNDIVTATGPAGQFVYNPVYMGKNLVFIAGGSGITPFASMVKEMTDHDLDINIHLIYGSRGPDDAPFHEEFEQIANRHPNFKYDLVVSDPKADWKGLTGFIDVALIKKLGIDTQNAMLFVCGPEEMYSFCIPELAKLGILPRRIRQEVQSVPADITADPAWPETISADDVFSIKLNDGNTVKAKANEPILVAIERAGLTHRNCCRAGECSLCRIKVVSGNVFQSSHSLVRESDSEAGYVHACVSYPLSDLEIIK